MTLNIEDLITNIGLTTPDTDIRSKLWSEIRSNKDVDKGPGVYFVSYDSPSTEPPFDDNALESWIRRGAKIKKRGTRLKETILDIQVLKDKLAEYWIHDEKIMYIGSTIHLQVRINQFNNHVLGMSRPHAGGQWVKTLLQECEIDGVANPLRLFWYPCGDYGSVENKLLVRFMGIQIHSRPNQEKNVLPFANLEYTKIPE